MRIIRHAWLASVLLALAAGSCTENGNGSGDDENGKSYNKKIDSYLVERYLWNDEYKQLTRDLHTEYTNDDNNLLTVTLMGMTTNTLDKKRYTANGQSYYRLYSYIKRTADSRTQLGLASRGVNHGVKKELEYSFGFAKLGVVKLTGTGKVGFYIMAVYPGSPADKAGFERGTILSEIDGATIDDSESVYMAIYKKLTAPTGVSTVSFKEYKGTAESIRLTAELLYPNPVVHAEIIDDESHKVGYLVYNSFDAAYDDALLDSLRKFKDAEITDMVLDLRYNGGGHVISSKMLATCIAGEACRNEVFQYYRYNEDRMANPTKTQQQTGNTYKSDKNLFYENFSYGNYYGVDLTQYTLDLPRLYVLTSGSTASSSEAVINGLRGIGIPVTLIGEKTNGKNVGMEVDKFDDGDYSYELTPITFQGYNVREETVPASGFTVDYTETEWNNGLVDFGPTEPLLAKALNLITGKTYTPAPARSAAAGILSAVDIARPDDSRRPSGMLALPPQDGE